jgi:2,5-dihydroxypyridine 5,6-dioxygenase
MNERRKKHMEEMSMLEMRGADTVVRTCANAKSGERVLIITDPTLLSVADKIAASAYALATEPVISVMTPREWDGQEPPDMVASAMMVADVIIFPTVKDIAHSSAMKSALGNGARAVSMAGCEADILSSPAMEADFASLRPSCDRAAELLSEAQWVRVTGPGGTDVTFEIAGRNGNAHSCILDAPGSFTGIPNIEANISPVEGTTTGTIVFDGSIPNLRTGVLDAPVYLTVDDGVVQKIEGGRDAKNLERMWREQNDPNVYNIAQFAMGMNPLSHEVTGGIVHDHGVYGSVHFGIGTSSNLGGKVKATGHIDGILLDAQVWLDDQLLLSERNFFLDGSGVRQSL